MQNVKPLPQSNTRAPREVHPALLDPAIRLFGTVNDAMFERFQNELANALSNTEGDIALELSTCGGDAETARRIALEVRLCREHHNRTILFFGKSFVYSAGITIMSGFEQEQRFLSRDCLLLIHARRLDKPVHFFGPLASNVQIAEEILGELKSGIQLERAGFARLAEGSKISAEEIEKRAARNWYATAQEALDCGLIAGII